MKRLVLFLAVLVLVQVSLFAGPFKKSAVPLKAKWVVHVDMEKAMSSTVGKELAALGSQDADKIIFINLAKNVKGFTFYGTDYQDGKLMAIIDGSGDILKLLDLLKTLGVLGDGIVSQKVTLEGFEVFKINIDRKDFLLFSQDNSIYVTKEESLMKLQLGMLLGKEKALSEGKNLAIELSLNKLIAFTSAGELPTKGDPAMSAAIKSIKTLQGGVYEEGSFAHLDVILKAVSSDAATTLDQFITGIVAFGKFKMSNKPFLLEVLNSVKITKVGDKITLKAKANVAEFLKMVKAHHNK